MIQNENCIFLYTTDAHKGPVEDLAFDTVHGRLASVGGGLAQVWDINSNGEYAPISKLHVLTYFRLSAIRS